ncbi:MAG: hypothetical protein BGO51_08170 [Rhodospirillales bacterium 69-11]|nr:hypothetical protein [Rhodospirillales bacterium]OJW25921.1 MAG: hypothetical protein BGO51_08170 [Rhodospirillales bacterium 69-11]
MSAAPIATCSRAAMDADLIAVCERLLAANRDVMTLYKRRSTMSFEDEAATDPEMDALAKRENAVLEELDQVGTSPKTMAGAVALARAALSQAPLAVDGTIEYADDAEWLAWSVVRFLAAVEVAP